MHELAELLPKNFLRRPTRLRVGGVVKTRGGDLGREPIGLGQTQREGNEVLLDLLLGKVFANLVQGLDSLVRVRLEDESGADILPSPEPRSPQSRRGFPEATAGRAHILAPPHTLQSCRAPRPRP